MRPALAGSTPFPRGPHSVGGSPGWASSSALVGWPSPELLPQCPPCFPPGPVPCIRWVGCGQAPMANPSPPSAGVHRHTCVVCMGQSDLVLARFPAGTRSLGGGPSFVGMYNALAPSLRTCFSTSKHGGQVTGSVQGLVRSRPWGGGLCSLGPHWRRAAPEPPFQRASPAPCRDRPSAICGCIPIWRTGDPD